METFTKAILLKLPADAPDGSVESVIATLNVIDKDGDVTLSGFFPKEPTPIKLTQAHDWQKIMLGKGTIQQVGDEAIFRGMFNLDDDDQEARALYSRLKFDQEEGADPLIEWSYAFRLKQDGFRFGEFEDEPVRFLIPAADESAGAIFDEVSPVLVGAGENTRTLDVKMAAAVYDEGAMNKILSDAMEASLKGSGAKYTEQIEKAQAAVEAVVARGSQITVLRSEKEQTLGADALAQLQSLESSLDEGRKAVADLIIRNTGELSQLAAETQKALYESAF